MKPIHKLNNGDGATLCQHCSKIISASLTGDLFCSQECAVKENWNYEEFKDQQYKYKLVREEDGLTKQSQDVMWLEFDENGKFKAKHKDIAVGRSLLMSPFSQFFTWQTTDIKEIIEQKEDYVKFKTTNSIYELHETTNLCR
jgi:hypothetical protein